MVESRRTRKKEGFSKGVFERHMATGSACLDVVKCTVEPRYHEPNSYDFLYPSSSKIYGKEPRYKETSL